MAKNPKKTMQELTKGFEEFAEGKDLKVSKEDFEKGIQKLVKKGSSKGKRK